MSDKFRQLQAEVIASRKPPKPPPLTIYLVAAYDGQAGVWKIHRETNLHEYKTPEEAERAADLLGARWVERTIIKVEL